MNGGAILMASLAGRPNGGATDIREGLSYHCILWHQTDNGTPRRVCRNYGQAPREAGANVIPGRGAPVARRLVDDNDPNANDRKW